MVNSNFLVDMLRESAHAVPREFVFLAKWVCQDGKVNPHELPHQRSPEGRDAVGWAWGHSDGAT